MVQGGTISRGCDGALLCIHLVHLNGALTWAMVFAALTDAHVPELTQRMSLPIGWTVPGSHPVEADVTVDSSFDAYKAECA